MKTREEVIERIRKVHTLTTSSNEHEAALALQRTFELLAEYRLTLADLAAEEIGREQVERYGGWADILLTVVAGQCGCTTLLHREGKPLTASIFGTRLDRTSAATLFRQMYATLQAQRDAAWTAHVASLMGPFGPHPATTEEGAEEEWKESFAYGAIIRIGAPLAEQVARDGKIPERTQALMVSRTGARDRARQHVEAKYGHAITKVPRSVTLDPGAVREGGKVDW